MRISAITVFVVFLVLRLVGVIHWSWWWITAPLWIAGLWAALALLSVALVAAGVAVAKKKLKL